ncbi:unnamed protein product [Linum tenue]|uniref:Uncharacterized protein n=1 Tax=Linum tenue TaxID=586396 RepID=A0AAV0PNA2_9ROSI|nr:unnamed protein product [Linum tenue]
MAHVAAFPCFSSVVIAARQRQNGGENSATRRQQQQLKTSGGSTKKGFGGERKELSWKCVEGCGACCKLAKGPSFATPEEIFSNPSDVELYRSLIGPDGWCIHYEKSTRKCSIYADRPYFCRVEVDVFESLYGIDKKKFNKEACSSCRDTIKAIYGFDSKELDNFNQSLKK